MTIGLVLLFLVWIVILRLGWAGLLIFAHFRDVSPKTRRVLYTIGILWGMLSALEWVYFGLVKPYVSAS